VTAPHGLDARTAALTRLAALVALRSPATSYRACTAEALESGATVDDIVGTLCTVASAVGLVRVVAAAPAVALAVGYDIDAALESLDRRGPCGGGVPRRLSRS
jgi:alkylhydroperoxidase/carboxymuconolactone decarboxylase family protein YurZ